MRSLEEIKEDLSHEIDFMPNHRVKSTFDFYIEVSIRYFKSLVSNLIKIK